MLTFYDEIWDVFPFTIYIFCLDKLTNHGKKFVIGFTGQYYRHKSGYIKIGVVGHLDTNVTIITKKSSSVPLNVTAYVKEGEFLEYRLPVSLRMSGKQYNGVEISSTANISLICLDHHVTYGADAYLALPTIALGISYVVASYQKYGSYGKTKIGIVSAHDENDILIKPSKNAVITYGGINYDDGSSVHVFLDKLQSIELVSTTDLSGTIVFSSKPISVTSSVDRSLISYDRLESLFIPVTQWGKQYILTPVGTMNKKQGDTFRIFAYYDYTIVKSGFGTKVLSSGTYTEITVGKNLTSFVNCSKPCQVVQYIRGELIGGKFADTSMTVVQSVKNFMSYYRVVPSYAQFYSSATITIQEGYTNGLYLDGVKMVDLIWRKITGTKYVWTVIGMPETKIATFYHVSPDVTFGLLVFGWNGVVSYAYPGGFAFEQNNSSK